jgi:DNA-binding SARP family transcriptional activator/tetratricopeptide (TPR) repeat protein
MTLPISTISQDLGRREQLARPADQQPAFLAKLAAPNPVRGTLRHALLDQAVSSAFTLFNAPAGYLLSESLAASLAEHGRPVLWLRLGHEDRDPGTFLRSLIAAAQRLHAGVGAATLEQMRRQPGPTSGWPRLFTQLAHEVAEALPVSSALVFEHSHFLNHTHPTMELLCAHLLPLLPESFTCVLTTREDIPHVSLPPRTARRSMGDLRLDTRTALEMLERAEIDLPGADVRRALGLSDGRAVVLAGLCDASAALGPALVQQAVTRANSMDDLLARIARAWLTAADGDALKALALAVRLEYSHPEIIAAALGRGAPPAGPWFQLLDDDWLRVRSIWQAPLRAALRAAATPDSASLRRTANYLAERGATDRAVSLYFEVGDIDSATHTINGAADQLMGMGQWETLSDWIQRLPSPSLRGSPWLVYAGGEIAAAQGDVSAALRAFALAASLFTSDHDAEGACQSMLAESAVAAWRGDNAHARARALAACTTAEMAGLAWHQGWAAWHMGCLAAADGELDDALAYFGRAVSAAEAINDAVMIELLRLAEALILRQRELRRQREYHRQAYFAAEQAEREVIERLRLMFAAPPSGLDDLLGTHSWSRTPLMLKLTAPAPEALPPPAGDTGFWGKLLGAVGLRRKPAPPAPVRALAQIPPPLDYIPPTQFASFALVNAQIGADSVHLDTQSPVASRGSSFPQDALPIVSELTQAAIGDSNQSLAPSADDSAISAGTPTLTVHLLGPFRVALNDHPIESWPSGRGRAVFKYLLAHSDRTLPRDVLMDAFWPDAEPEAARNSLNVALHGLRQALRAADDLPVVIFQDGAYRLNPELHLWLDSDEFERRVTAGRRFEATGQIAAAAAEYEVATGLYQGDFMADDPYDEWPVITRERLRIAYLDTLDRLSQIYFSQGQYGSCASLCQHMLTQDNCREDAHCRLMRCYSRQSQQHLALRQYQICVKTLRDELDVEPSLTTIQLYERIRRRERI